MCKRDAFFVMRFNGSYILCKTASGMEDGAGDPGVIIYRSEDLLNWTEDNAGMKDEEAEAFAAAASAASEEDRCTLSPDLDSVYIVQDAFYEAEDQKAFRIGFSRLFRNKSRGYLNPCPWEQEVPERPSYEFRGGEDMTCENGIAWFNAAVLPEFTAEWNLISKEHAKLYFGRGEIVFEEGRLTVREDGKVLASCEIPDDMTADRNVTLRLEHRMDGFCRLYYRDFTELLSFESAGRIMRIGIAEKDLLPDRYFAVSNDAFGSSDRAAVKAVPGRFDAVHALEFHTEVEALEEGKPVNVVKAAAGDSFTFPVNVKKDGTYALAVTVRNSTSINDSKTPLSFTLEAGGRSFYLAAEDITETPEGACELMLGTFTLPGGKGKLKITAGCGALIDHFRIFESPGEEDAG